MIQQPIMSCKITIVFFCEIMSCKITREILHGFPSAARISATLASSTPLFLHEVQTKTLGSASSFRQSK